MVPTSVTGSDEKFVDPESGKLLTVWFARGDRRYVEDAFADRT